MVLEAVLFAVFIYSSSIQHWRVGLNGQYWVNSAVKPALQSHLNVRKRYRWLISIPVANSHLAQIDSLSPYTLGVLFAQELTLVNGKSLVLCYGSSYTIRLHK